VGVAEALASLGPLVLASRSPQRRAILTQLGIEFTVAEPDYDEVPMPGLTPSHTALVHARGKAQSVAGEVVLGVDTVVDVDNTALGKPADEDEARAMLRALAGREHLVHSGLCLIAHGRQHGALATTAVRFRPLDEGDLDWYLRCREWEGRAGGYAIQGRGAALVESIDGDHSNVVGLPVAVLLDAVLETALPSP
jgi:septum formation protein